MTADAKVWYRMGMDPPKFSRHLLAFHVGGRVKTYGLATDANREARVRKTYEFFDTYVNTNLITMLDNISAIMSGD